ncbi:MAG: hypothetical protein J6W17_02085 [Campylobacter sp.]|nr:hypothetical protein [Campylobacter sp.]
MNIKWVLPQSGYMVFLDEIKQIKQGEIIYGVSVKNSPFLENERLGSYAYIEIMAQSIAAYAGSNDKIELGFLLSCRKMDIFRPFVNVGDELIIKAIESLSDGAGMFVFDCEILLSNECVAKASLSVLNPSKEFLDKAINE